MLVLANGIRRGVKWNPICASLDLTDDVLFYIDLKLIAG